MAQKRSVLRLALSSDDVRRIEPENDKEVERLKVNDTEYLFGEKPVQTHLEKNFLTLGIYNGENELVGAVSFNSYPNISSIPPLEWNYFLHNLYHVNVTPMTTLWIHYAVWDTDYRCLVLKPLLKHLFEKITTIENVFMVCPPGIKNLDFIDQFSTRLVPYGYYSAQKVQTIFHAKREDLLPKYIIRRAVEEDNDDLVEIIPKLFKETYGDYYISEMLREDEESERQLIVAEFEERAVGVLCLNNFVDYKLLNQTFELVPYNGFKQPNIYDKVLSSANVPSHTELPVLEDNGSNDNISIFGVNAEIQDPVISGNPDEQNGSEDSFSLMNLSSSLILNLKFLYDEEQDLFPDRSTSVSSIESSFSVVILNEGYESHLFAFEKGGDTSLYDEKSARHLKSTNAESTFFGESNAFTMEICTSVKKHRHCLYLLFKAVFACFPDRDYCITSLPTSSPLCYLVQHFARVIPKPNSTFSHELYVLHKSAILGQLSVRVATSEDTAEFNDIVKSIEKFHEVQNLFKEAVDNSSNIYKPYVFFCENQIIGAAILYEEENIEHLLYHYNIEEWIDTRGCRFGIYGCIKLFLISPIFQRHISFILRELHRLSDFEILFHCLKTNSYLSVSGVLPISNCISHMAPLRPNFIPEYSKDVKKEFQLPDATSKLNQSLTLYMSTVRLTNMETIDINHRMVIIGAGSTTLAFLETLLFQPKQKYLIKFSNITVVSPHGIVYQKRPSALRDKLFVSNGHFDRQYLDSLCLKTYVHVVTGVINHIDRKEKYIRLTDYTKVPYDYLLLLGGEQFQKPPENKDIKQKRNEFPHNVFIINTEVDAANALNQLQHLTEHQKQGTMVVFGHYLEALCCLTALLEFGVKGSNLVYVDPLPEANVSYDRHEHLTQYFNNNDVEQAVINEIVASQVTVYQEYNFVQWHQEETANIIKSAKFESKYKFVEIELSALFIYYGKSVSMRTFQAIAKSGLVFNGRLVIDKNFQTNDPCILGAGPLTMYSKKYYAEHLLHKYFNSKEVGFNLAQEIRKRLIPKQYQTPPPKISQRFQPIVQYCKFPGGLYYLQISKPGRPVPLDVATSKSNYGKVLITGDCKNLQTQGYFRLHLNQFYTVETITCLSKNELQLQNLISLWGKHEMLLNHLGLRFRMNKIKDFFIFFTEPWAYAIYHKNFSNVMDDINNIFKTTKSSDGKTLVEEITERLEENDWNLLSTMQLDEIAEICRDNQLFQIAEKKLEEFLHENSMYLPMYLHHLLIRWILAQIRFNPLFVKCTFVSTKLCDMQKDLSKFGY